ncbi:MAG: retroviral-like aspartic protease family protein [Sphingomonadales bacterium]|nr:retroviral-like aspartic protease family protein [Sphingomonadales bacterium]
MNLAELRDFLVAQPLLALAALAILFASIGWIVQHSHPRAASALRIVGYAGMVGTVLLTVIEAAHHAGRSDVRIATGKVGAVEVIGGETVVPLDPSGHYWIKAQLNGNDAEFLVDTGATYTSLAPALAREAGITADAGRMPIELNTANGPIAARFGTAHELTFGSVTARDLEVVIGPETGDDTSVIGMNLLSKLKGWRVENKKLVLVPAGSP